MIKFSKKLIPVDQIWVTLHTQKHFSTIMEDYTMKSATANIKEGLRIAHVGCFALRWSEFVRSSALSFSHLGIIHKYLRLIAS